MAALSSDYEGQPLSVLEYMAAGKPIVSTRVGGLAEMVEDGTEGLLVPRRDPEALAAALTRMLLDRPAAGADGCRRPGKGSSGTSRSRPQSGASRRCTKSLWGERLPQRR